METLSAGRVAPRAWSSCAGLPFVVTASAVALLAIVPQCGLAVQAIPVRDIQTITVSLNQRGVVGLPFNEEFLLSVPVKSDMVAVDYALVPLSDGVPTVCLQRWTLRTVADDPTTATLAVTVLRPNEDYTLTLNYWLNGSTPPAISGCPTPAAGCTPASSCESVRIPAATPAALSTHFAIDFGYVYALNSQYHGLMVSTNIHLTPVNRNAPSWWGSARQNFSLVLGLSVAEFDSQAQVEKPWGAGMPMLGIGVLLPGHDTRVQGGVIIFDQVDANPLVSARQRKADWFVAVTTDSFFKGLLGSVGTLLGLK